MQMTEHVVISQQLFYGICDSQQILTVHKIDP